MRESGSIEFCSISETSGRLKESTLRTIISFLNSDGGSICIPTGKRDEGLPEIIKSQIEESISPNPLSHIRIDFVEMDEERTLVMDVEKGNMTPYFIRKVGISTDGVYSRCKDRTRKATEEEIRRLIIESFSTSWEDTVSPIQDLSFNDCGIPLPLITEEDGKYTKLGLMLSDQNPYSIWISEFENDNSIPEVTEIKGPLLRIYEETIRKIESRYTYSYSIPYPMKAIREILLNAISHRDYSYMSGNVINIYPDRIQFTSIGSPMRPVTADNMAEGIKAERNPKLKRILEELSKVRGIGVRAAIKDARDNGFRIEFKESGDIFSVTIRRVKPLISNEYTYDLNPSYKDVLLMESDTPYGIERKSELDDVYSYIVINGAATRKDIEKILGIHATKAYYLLTELVERGMVIQEKKGRSSYYHLP